MQRSRLLAAAAVTVDELGYAGASVAHISARAGVSRRTFYELFANREECLLAVLDEVVVRVAGELAAAGVGGLPWRERVRTGLWTVLCFLEREPVLGRVCVVQSLRGGQRVLERREVILGGLAAVVDEGRLEGLRARECPSLTAQGLVGAAHAVLYAHLLRGSDEPLTGLLGELMGMIVLPYLGPTVARREQARSVPTLPTATGNGARSVSAPGDGGGDLLQGLPMRLTYRTARVLEIIAEQSGISNRNVAERAGITDQGQASRLLARLERLGLIANTGEGHSKGESNAWSLTGHGEHVTRSIHVLSHQHQGQAA